MGRKIKIELYLKIRKTFLREILNFKKTTFNRRME
jgi:hypothetical protein